MTDNIGTCFRCGKPLLNPHVCSVLLSTEQKEQIENIVKQQATAQSEQDMRIDEEKKRRKAEAERDKLLAEREEREKQGKAKFLLNGARLKLSFREVECPECGCFTEEVCCAPIDQYKEQLDGEWVALVPAANNEHLSLLRPVPAVPEGMVLVPKEPT